VGELVQYATSYHLRAPQAATKWYLITFIDDHRRDFLYADLWAYENSWAHLAAVKIVVTGMGCPLKYYVENHSIFRFIEKRDTVVAEGPCEGRGCECAVEGDAQGLRYRDELCLESSHERQG